MVPFEWDGKDSFGREIQGTQAAEVGVTFVYPASYAATSGFAGFGNGEPLTGDPARGEFLSRRSSTVSLGTYRATGVGLGGWTLSPVHAYEPGTRQLNFGSGGRREQDSLPMVTQWLAGTNGFFTSSPTTPTEGGQAKGANLAPRTITVDAEGRIYSSTETTPVQLWRTNRNGTLSRMAAAHNWGRIEGMDAAPDGSIYLAIRDQHVIKKLAPNGTVSVIAGTGTSGFSGDGGPATSAALNSPRSVAVASDGSLFLYDANERIRRVLPDGTIRTVAGIGHSAEPWTLPTPGTSALTQHIELLNIAAGPDGTIYATGHGEDPFASYVLKFGSDGTVETIAGDGCTFGCPNREDGLAPLATAFDILGAIDVDQNGTIYVEEGGYWVRTIQNGVVGSAAGCADCFTIGAADGTPALGFYPYFMRSIVLGPDGLYLTSQGDTIHRIQSPLPASVGLSLVIPSMSGDEFFEFDSNGKHLKTRHALTGADLLTLGYDASSRLTSLTNEVNHDDD
jgi:hypothetical protein